MFFAEQPAHRALRDIVGERTRPLIVWTGAGLSVSAGLPTWGGLRESLIEVLTQTAEAVSPEDRQEAERFGDVVRAEANPWVCFEMLERKLGATTYRDSICDALTPPADAEPPLPYRMLWRLRPAGMLTLNLDDLAARAYVTVHPGHLPIMFDGRSIGRLPHVFNAPRPFLVNLHGVVDDRDSWVLTKAQLRRSLGNTDYRRFLEVCLLTATVLFIGVGADDLAVGGHLDSLAKLRLQTSSHFWLTDRVDAPTKSWAEETGVRIIQYHSRDNDHGEVIEFLEDLLAFVPSEDPAPPPVVLERSAGFDQDHLFQVPPSLPSEADMRSWAPEEIRKVLNTHAVSLLAPNTAEAYEEYMRFCNEYDETLHRAWYTSTVPGRNILLGYELLEDAKKGAFGRVFRAKAADGSIVAIKLLHPEIRGNQGLLEAFRRGVRSMSILDKHRIPGMVGFIEASEIPAFAAMEWIDGPNLAEAYEARQITDWQTFLSITCQLAEIVRAAHALPEKVLHRDIRPPNVMLGQWYSDHDNWSVTLLDFDLSWHAGSTEHSVAYSTAIGYLAPEQLHASSGVSTRHAAVDSFGLGMTCYFVVSGQDPVTEQHRHVDWVERVQAACQGFADSPVWRSVPSRVARLVIAATSHRQSLRWDIGTIQRELAQLAAALYDPEGVRSAELLAEEVAARSNLMGAYEWIEDDSAAVARLGHSRFVLSADESADRIRFVFEWTSAGGEDRSGLAKYLSQAVATAESRLKAGGWSIRESSGQGRALFVEAQMRCGAVVGRVDEVAASLDRCTDGLDILTR